MKKKLLIFGSIFLITALAIGAELQSFYKAKFSGLNNSVNIRLLSDDDASDISNFSLDEIGSIKERDLFGQYNSSSGALGSNFITGLFKHYTTDSKFFFACAGTKIGLGSGGAFTDISPSNSTVVTGSYYSGVTFNNRFYLFNPTSKPLVSLGSSSFHYLENNSAIPGTNCAYSAIHKSRVWAARSDSLPYRLYWSSLNNAEDWVTTGGYADLPDLTQTITGLTSWGGYLYVFTETNIYVLLGSTPNDFSLRKTNSMVGAIASLSIKVTDIGICFLSRSGVYAFDGNNSNKISDKIRDTISGFSNIYIKNACAIYDGQRYWLAYTPTDSSYNNIVIIYDILLKDWYEYEGSACNISYFERAYGGTDKGELYGGSSIPNGYVYQLQASTGTESITHNTQSDFNTDVTFNTVVTDTPTVELLNGVTGFCKTMLHFDGSDGSTTFTDSSYQNHTYTAGSANVKLVTAQSKFGGSSCRFPSAGNDYLQTIDSEDWFLGTNDFTIDFWVRFNSVAQSTIINQWQDANNYWRIGQPGGPSLYFIVVDGGVTKAEYTQNYSFTTATWYHIAIVRSGTSLYMFINGVLQSPTVNTAIGSNSIPNLTATLLFGQSGDGTNRFDGWIDEPRIIKGKAIWTTSFTPPAREYELATSNGTLTSQNIQINASGTTTLDKITWLDSLPSNTKITFQTRTGVTNDSVYFSSWQYWSSANTVTLNTVTNGTVQFTSSTNDGSFTLKKPFPAIDRNVLYYEDEDVISANCVSINTVGAISTDKYIEAFIPTTNLSSYDWLCGWYKSPATGNAVEFYIGNGISSGNYVTFNTVQVNTWEKWYWYIGGISSANRSNINYIKYRYKGDVAGGLVIGEVTAHNFYNSGDIISSNPNDYIQYRSILGTEEPEFTPKLSSVTLIYTPSLLVSESALSSYYYTKWFDFKTPQLNKQYESLVLEANSTTSSSCIIYCDYDIDFGTKTGTLSFPVTTTANTVRILKNFPSNTYGKAMRLKIYNNDKNATVTIKGTEVRYRVEPVTPD